MEEVINLVENAFKETHKDYNDVFKKFYPAQGSNGFTERNQTFFFTKNLLAEAKGQAICWQEMPFGNKGEHFDTLIHISNHDSVIYIEAKRFRGGVIKNQDNSLVKDVKRLCNEGKAIKFREELQSKLGFKNEYILAIADIWARPDGKGGFKHKDIHNWNDINWLSGLFGLDNAKIAYSNTTLHSKLDLKVPETKQQYNLLMALIKL